MPLVTITALKGRSGEEKRKIGDASIFNQAVAVKYWTATGPNPSGAVLFCYPMQN